MAVKSQEDVVHEKKPNIDGYILGSHLLCEGNFTICCRESNYIVLRTLAHSYVDPLAPPAASS